LKKAVIGNENRLAEPNSKKVNGNYLSPEHLHEKLNGV